MSRLLCTMLCLALFLPLAGGCAARNANLGGPKPSAEELERQGDELLSQGRREAAFMHYAKAVAEDPALVSARFKQGRLYADRGMHREALAAFSAILEQRPDDLPALEAAGRAAYEAGNLKAAEDFFRRDQAVNPERPDPHVFLGVLASRTGDRSKAEAEFRAALAVKPDCPEALNGLGLEALAAGRAEEAVTHLVAALRAGAPVQRGYNNLGLALVAAGRDKEALVAFTRAAGEAGGYNNLGLALLGQGRTAEAAALLQRAADISPTYYERAERNLEQARLDLTSLSIAAPHSLAPQTPGPVPATPLAPAPPGARAAAGTGSRTSLQESDLVEPARGVARALPQLAPVVRPASLTVRPAGSEAAGVPATREAVEVPAEAVATPAVASAPDGANLAALFSAPAPAPARPEAGSATPPETSQAIAPEHRYGVHLASFRERWRAEALAAEYGRKGVETLIYAYEVPGKGTWQRIAAGPFADFDQAGAAATRLRGDLNLDYARVVRLPGGPAVSAGPAGEDGR